VSDGVGGGAPAVAEGTPIGNHVATIISDATTRAAQPAVAFAGVVVTAGAVISLLVPNIPAEHERMIEVEEWVAAPADGTESDPDEETEPSPA
jgi:hypothetical protein